MYPTEELNLLNARKVELLRRIALSRAQCIDAAAVLHGPLAELDRGWELWRKVAPLVKVALSSFNAFFPRTRQRGLNVFGTLMRWAPFILRTVKAMKKKE